MGEFKSRAIKVLDDFKNARDRASLYASYKLEQSGVIPSQKELEKGKTKGHGLYPFIYTINFIRGLLDINLGDEYKEPTLRERYRF